LAITHFLRPAQWRGAILVSLNTTSLEKFAILGHYCSAGPPVVDPWFAPKACTRHDMYSMLVSIKDICCGTVLFSVKKLNNMPK
jgi:hypothetical protein